MKQPMERLSRRCRKIGTSISWHIQSIGQSAHGFTGFCLVAWTYNQCIIAFRPWITVICQRCGALLKMFARNMMLSFNTSVAMSRVSFHMRSILVWDGRLELWPLLQEPQKAGWLPVLSLFAIFFQVNTFWFVPIPARPCFRSERGHELWIHFGWESHEQRLWASSQSLQQRGEDKPKRIYFAGVAVVELQRLQKFNCNCLHLFEN